MKQGKLVCRHVVRVRVRLSGNLGDVIQPIAMEHLLASIAPNQCFWYADPYTEKTVRDDGQGKFFGGDLSRLIYLAPEDAMKVRGVAS